MVWNKGTKGICKPNSTSFKKGDKTRLGKSHSKETKIKIREKLIGKKIPSISGKKSHWWKGGITPINEAIRKSLEYKLWRKAVFERDSYTCIWCGDDKSGNLQADHIKPFSLYKKLRFKINNGRTLCVACHKKTDTYGKKIDNLVSLGNLTIKILENGPTK